MRLSVELFFEGLTLNSSELGYEMCEKIIIECVKNF